MKRKVLFVNDEMVVGGVARVLNNMLKYLDPEKVEIDLLVLHKHGEMLKDVPSYVNVIEGSSFFKVCDQPLKELIKNHQWILVLQKFYLLFLMKSGLIFSKIRAERKKFLTKEYDVEIAYKEGFCTVFVASGNSKKKVNWVHVDYKVHNYSSNHMGLVKKALDQMDVHVAQSHAAAAAYKEVFNLKQNFEVIYNCIDIEKIQSQAKEEYVFPHAGFHAVSVGRLHFQKAYLRMIEVHRQLIEAGIQYHFYVVGDGEERKEIETKIKEYHLEDTFHLMGYDSNPFKYVHAADLFVLQSLYESAPTVVYEALTVNETPILTTDVAGVREQLKDGKLGMIVENSERGLVEGLKQCIGNEELLQQYKKAMKEYTNSNEISLSQIERLLYND
jgi:glycosyltransferase involved in cell wall biosynthesis